MNTAAALAMKRIAACLLLSVWCSAQSQPIPQPTSVNCTISTSDPQRPDRWQLFITKSFDGSPSERKWVSDHDSSASAMKSCEKILAAQRKVWKKQLKDSKGKKK